MDCQSYLAWTLWPLGYPDQALVSIHQALTLAEGVSHPISLATALFFAAWLHQYRREAQTVQAQAEAAMALSTEQRFPQFLAGGMVLQGWALAAQGQGAEGIVQLRQGMAAWLATGAAGTQPYFLGLLAEVYGKVEQVEEGLAMLAEALAAVHNSGECYYEAQLHRLQGELLLALSREHDAEAEICFQRALEVARRQQAKSLELRAAMSLGRLWQHQGKTAQARQLLAEVYAWFTEGFDTVDLKEAKALLAQWA
jgi:predicted ATPase